MGSPNGGIIGVINPSSFGKCTQTVTTSSGPLTTQPGTRVVQTLIVAGGGGGGGGYTAACVSRGGGGGAGGFRCIQINVCGATSYPITVGAGGTGGPSVNPGNATSGCNSSFGSNSATGGGKGGMSNGAYPVPVRSGASWRFRWWSILLRI
jgi:hypothetical protein